MRSGKRRHFDLSNATATKGRYVEPKSKQLSARNGLSTKNSLSRHIASLPTEAVVSGVASDANQPPAPEIPLKTAPATNDNGDAGDASVRELATPTGETRSLATVLIENSKLLAKLEGKDEVLTERNRVIDELRDDRTFLREELK